MQMKEIEIVGKYNRATNKKEQITILAQLNGCSEEDIRKVLIENGINEEDLPKKPGRKPGNKVTGDKGMEKDVTKNREALADMLEIPELTPKEEAEVDRALAIPEPVRKACEERVAVLTEKIKEIEKERDCIQDYLMGVIKNG